MVSTNLAVRVLTVSKMGSHILSNKLLQKIYGRRTLMVSVLLLGLFLLGLTTLSVGVVLILTTYPIDYKKIINKIRNLQLPLVPCRSKSGGMHIFLFLKNPVSARLVREKLREVASGLGYSSVEVFPKQSTILIEKGDLGNFLNLPYYNSKSTTRYAYKDDGTAATIARVLFFI